MVKNKRKYMTSFLYFQWLSYIIITHLVTYLLKLFITHLKVKYMKVVQKWRDNWKYTIIKVYYYKLYHIWISIIYTLWIEVHLQIYCVLIYERVKWLFVKKFWYLSTKVSFSFISKVHPLYWKDINVLKMCIISLRTIIKNSKAGITNKLIEEIKS